MKYAKNYSKICNNQVKAIIKFHGDFLDEMFKNCSKKTTCNIDSSAILNTIYEWRNN